MHHHAEDMGGDAGVVEDGCAGWAACPVVLGLALAAAWGVGREAEDAKGGTEDGVAGLEAEFGAVGGVVAEGVLDVGGETHFGGLGWV